MLVLRIYGMPLIPPGGATHTNALLGLTNKLRIATSRVLKILPKEVLVFYPADMLDEGLGEELVCFVDRLFDEPDQSSAFDHELLSAIVDEVVKFSCRYLPNCSIVVVNDKKSGTSAIWERSQDKI